MGRQPQPEIRQRLLEACVDHALAHGLPDRLEPLASATGTSARMLVYHFGTRDALLREVLGQARQRQLDAWGALLQVRQSEPYAVTLERAWTAFSGADGRPYLRLFGQWRESAGSALGPEFRRAATTDWLGPLEQGTGSPAAATLALAVVRGLLMDLDATGDTARADAAFQAFLAGLSGSSSGTTSGAASRGRATSPLPSRGRGRRS